MVDISNAMNLFLISVIVCLAVLILCCLFRAIKGPRITDRVVAINMIGSLVIIIICIFSRLCPFLPTCSIYHTDLLVSTI